MDDTNPATKADVKAIMESNAKILARVEELNVSNERWMHEVHRTIKRSRRELHRASERFRSELRKDFGDAIKTIRQDLQDAHREGYGFLRDEQEKHGTRLARVEARVGIFS